MPGVYKVFLAKNANGVITKLTEPVSFKAVVLGTASLPAEDRAELVEFQQKVRELSRAVNASARVANEFSDRIKHYKVALKSITAPEEELTGEIKTIETKIREIQKKLYGDRILRRLDKDAVPGLSNRINIIIYEQWRSTSAPTQTQRKAYEIVADEFSGLLEELKKLVEENAAKIEKKLEKMGAPFTPGRLPEWKKK
jgi:hypothetical protein